MSFLAAALPPSQPSLVWLVGGFVLLVAGLAYLTVGPRRVPARSALSTRRALLYAVVYGLCAACFTHVLQTALLGRERSPWLLALGDVIFITLSLYIWVMVLAEGHPLNVFGFRRIAAGRLFLTLLMGLGAVVVYSLAPWLKVWRLQVPWNADSAVFSLLFAAAGSALPEEILFRGFLTTTLEGRVGQWARVVLPALAFTAIRCFRFLPGDSLGVADWIGYIFEVALPLGLWWGLMRELAGGAIWPCIVSHFLLELGPLLAGKSPALP
jgi:membrane protease YdiL (CAAX protease family)